ncbi:MAG: hypothetical protein SF053_04630 [Bacteroidia bacterium]|nr:hypothetical protein [Bacteroidia bacterium]
MISWFITQAEKSLRVPLDYLRVIARHSLSGFIKFSLFTPLSAHRTTLAPALWHIARIRATQLEDCGTCVQITVNQALDAGIPAPLIAAVVRGEVHTLSDAQRLILNYTTAVCQQDEAVALPLRETFLQQYGEAALVDLALGIATARVYPTTKRALGLAVSCARVEVAIPG